MATGWLMLATEQACHDIPMREVVRDRAERDGMGRGHSKGLWEFSLIRVRLKSGRVHKCLACMVSGEI